MHISYFQVPPNIKSLGPGRFRMPASGKVESDIPEDEPRGDRGPGGGQRGGLRGARCGSLRVHRGGDPGGHDFGREPVAEAPWTSWTGALKEAVETPEDSSERFLDGDFLRILPTKNWMASFFLGKKHENQTLQPWRSMEI